jgi:hypothetical protein
LREKKLSELSTFGKFTFPVLLFLCLAPIDGLAQSISIPDNHDDPTHLADVQFREVLQNGIGDTFPAKNCLEWATLTDIEKEAYDTDKIAEIDLTMVRNTCWLFARYSNAQPAKVLIGDENALASLHNFPAALLFWYENNQHVKEGKLTPKGDGMTSFTEWLSAEQQDINLSLFADRPKTIAQLGTEYILFPRKGKRINFSNELTFHVKLNEQNKVEASFLRTRMQVQVVFKKHDIDGDGREDLGVLVEYEDVTANYSMCYAAILTRPYSDPKEKNIFRLEESIPAGRCS